MSKELEALDNLRQECKATYFDEKGKQWWTTDKKADYRCNIIEKELKALEIIKEKRVDVSWLFMCFNFIENCSIEDELDYYNNNYEAYRKSKPLTQEEYDLLKETLL